MPNKQTKWGNITIDMTDVERVSRAILETPVEATKALKTALKRSEAKITRLVGTEVSKRYNIDRGKVESTKVGSTQFDSSSLTGISSSMRFVGHTLSMSNFDFFPQIPGTGITPRVTIKRAKPQKQIRSKPPAFVAGTGALTPLRKDGSLKTMYNVFKREGKSRTPIEVIRTLSVPQMFSGGSDLAQEANKVITEQAQEYFMERFLVEYKHYLNKQGG
jgi:hypothetical protein